MKYERYGKPVTGEEAWQRLAVIHVHGFLAKLLTAMTGVVQLAVILVPLVFLFPEIEFSALVKGHVSSIAISVFLMLFLLTKPGPAGPGCVSFKPFS